MKWWIEGVHMDTGEPAKGYVDGASEDDARAAASAERIAVARCITADSRRVEQRQISDAANEANAPPPDQQTFGGWVTGGRRVAKAAVYAGETVAEARRLRRMEKVQTGEHIQRVTIHNTGSLVFVVAIGVFVGMLAFSCCGGGLVLSGLAGAFSEAANP